MTRTCATLLAVVTVVAILIITAGCGGNASPAPTATNTTPTASGGSGTPPSGGGTGGSGSGGTGGSGGSGTGSGGSGSGGSGNTATGADFVYLTTADGIAGYSIPVQQPSMHAIPGSPFAAPNAVQVATAGNLVYAIGYVPGNQAATGSISVYRADATTGALTLLKTTPWTTPDYPRSVFTDPSQQYLYIGAQSNGELIYGFKIDSASGSLTAVPGSPFVSNDTATVGAFTSGQFTADGKLLFGIECPYSGGRFCSLAIVSMQRDTATGALMRPANNTAWEDVEGIAVSPNSNFVVADLRGSQLGVLSFDSSGAMREVPGFPFPAEMNPCAAAFQPSGNFLYVASYSNTTGQPGAINGYTLDSAGKPTRVSGATATTKPPDVGKCSLAFTPSGFLTFASTSNLEAFTVGSSGTLSEFGSVTIGAPTEEGRKQAVMHSNSGQ